MIRNHRFQNHVVESVYTLPLCVVLCLLLWWWPNGASGVHSIGNCVLCMLVAGLIMETNSVYQLIRLRTRIMACVWMFLVVCLPAAHDSSLAFIPAFCLSVAHYMMFDSYQNRNASVSVFHGCLSLSLCSLCYAPALLLVIPYLFLLQLFMQSLSLRTLGAGLIGLGLPYWLLFPLSLWFPDLFSFEGHFVTFMELPDMFLSYTGSVSPLQWGAFGLVAFLGLLASVHFVRHDYNDKIRTRMMLYVYVYESFFFFVLLFLFPCLWDSLFVLFLACISPLIAHYFALTGSRITNLLFCASLLSCAFFYVLRTVGL